jgi:hypothetical protein
MTVLRPRVTWPRGVSYMNKAPVREISGGLFVVIPCMKVEEVQINIGTSPALGY